MPNEPEKYPRRPALRVVVYVAGPFSSPDRAGILYNISRAVIAAAGLRRRGFVAVVPHLESFFSEDTLSYTEWVEHGIQLMKRCDAVLVLPASQDSIGVGEELKAAEGVLPVLDTIAGLELLFGVQSKGGNDAG